MRVKTSDLTGAALDWAVAKANGLLDPQPGFPQTPLVKLECGQIVKTFAEDPFDCLYEPSEDWSQGGPIIADELIRLDPGARHAGRSLPWYAERWVPYAEASGPTPLIAAMRCFVAGALGDEIEIPDSLT